MFLPRRAFLVLFTFLIGSAALTGITFAKSGVSHHYNDRLEVSWSSRYECMGEDIWITGVMHVVTDTYEDQNIMSIRQHVNSHFTGVGQTTGNTYVVNETTNTSQEYTLSEFQQSGFSQIWSYKAISQGSAPNFMIHLNMHWSWVNGELKQDQYHWEPGC